MKNFHKVLFLCIAVCAFAFGKEETDPVFVDVSILELIVNPVLYESKHVAVYGILCQSSKHDPYRLVPNPFNVKNIDFQSQIICQISDDILDHENITSEDLSEGVFVRVVGLFEISGGIRKYPGLLGKSLDVLSVLDVAAAEDSNEGEDDSKHKDCCDE